MKNIETKLFIRRFSEVDYLLKNIKAEHIGKMRQKDIYYNCGLDRLKLRIINRNRFELIFYKRPNKTSARISDYKIFNIKPSQVKCFKSLIGTCFRKQVVVEKIRDLWIFRNTRIHLDKVIGLGSFLELETVVKKNLKSAKSEFKKIFNLLNLDNYKQCAISYSDLLLKNHGNS